MTPAVAVVTDSTSYLPASVALGHGIGVVALDVVVGGTAYPEGSGIAPAEVADALRAWTPVTTSRPAPETFLRAWSAAVDAGAREVVSVHLSAELSGTVASAQLAAKDAPVPVEVVDSRSLGMGLGFAAVAGAVVAAAGAGRCEVARAARERAERTRVFFCVDTLEYLRRGGRIGTAAALLGSALSVKPLLQLTDGRIALLEKVRTSGRARARLEDVAVAAVDDMGGETELAVQHLGAADQAAALAERLGGRTGAPVVVTEVGAVVGAHVGPGVLGVVVAPR